MQKAFFLSIYALGLLFAFAASLVMGAEESSNMIGRQSQNEGLRAVPTKGKVLIDGDLSEWDWSGRIIVFADNDLRGRYSVEVGAMWDEDNLYLAAKWADPTPMFSMVDPKFNPDKGWQADAWQLRFKTDQTRHLTAWYYAKEKQPCFSVSGHPAGYSPRMLKQKGDTEFEDGIGLAFRRNEDGAGYVEEVRIPWSFIYSKAPAIKAGHTLRLGSEFLWGDTSGQGTVHRYADNMQPGVTSREFYWQKWESWGDITLLATGNIEPRRYISRADRPQGTIPVRVELPADAKRFTIAINKTNGERVRNLAGDMITEDYRVALTKHSQSVEVLWDGTDDEGKLVEPGTYTLVGLTHKGIGAEYEMCFYNPGTPPWSTPDGAGSWGGDHASPRRVARAGDWMAISWSGAEGGSGLIGIGTDGKKKWGEKRGAMELAANEKYVFGVLGHGHGPHMLCRYGKDDGAYKPFEKDGKERPFEWRVGDISGSGKDEWVTAIAANDATVAMGLKPFEKSVFQGIDVRIQAPPPSNADKKKYALYIDELTFEQIAEDGTITTYVGAAKENGSFEDGKNGYKCYWASKFDKVVTGETKAAGGEAFVELVSNAEIKYTPRLDKSVSGIDLDKGKTFRVTAKVRAGEANGFASVNVGLIAFEDGRRPLKIHFSEQTPISSERWTVVHGEFDFEMPDETPSARIVVLDAETGERKAVHATGAVTGLTFAPNSMCYAIIDGKMVVVDLETGKTLPIETPGLQKPVGLATDGEGNILTFDAGPDSRVKAYSPQGELVYTCGKKGGRPPRGTFEKQGTRNVRSVAVDHTGKVWTVEAHNDPRRVSVWNRDGTLARDYIGNTGYSGTGTYLNPDEPDAAYIGSVRMKIDRETRSYEVTDILWVPDPEKGEAFPLWNRPHHFANPGFVKSKASGKERTYLYFNGMYGRWHGIYMQRNGCWQPVAVIGEHRIFQEMLPNLAIPGSDGRHTVYWNDTNKDGAVQPGECEIEKQRAKLPGHWNHLLASDLVIRGKELTAYGPVRFTDDGAPVYGLEGKQETGREWRKWDAGIAIEEAGVLLAGNQIGARFLHGVDRGTKKILWRYPNPYRGVHGSHDAPMPKPGLLIGPLKQCGVVDMGGEIGSVFAMRGNLGQDFYMTHDGLYVGAMFRDLRLPGPPLPEKEEDLVGQPVDIYSNGSEPFNGWFGKQSDGTIRMVNGIPGQAAMMCRINGLETIRRFKPEALELDGETLALADRENALRKAKASEPKIYVVKKTAANPLDDAKQWDNLEKVELTRPGTKEKAAIQLGYDDTNLYARFVVADDSPWRNAGKDHTRLFKTGDCVDIHLGTHTDKTHKAPQQGDQRILISQHEGEPVAVLMRVVGGVRGGRPVTYRTNWSKTLAGVGVIEQARIEVTPENGKYTVVASIPLKAIDLSPNKGETILGDFGFISSDDNGQVNTARTYWSNKATNLVSDEPFEAWLYPETWGAFRFE